MSSIPSCFREEGTLSAVAVAAFTGGGIAVALGAIAAVGALLAICKVFVLSKLGVIGALAGAGGLSFVGLGLTYFASLTVKKINRRLTLLQLERKWPNFMEIMRQRISGGEPQFTEGVSTEIGINEGKSSFKINAIYYEDDLVKSLSLCFTKLSDVSVAKENGYWIVAYKALYEGNEIDSVQIWRGAAHVCAHFKFNHEARSITWARDRNHHKYVTTKFDAPDWSMVAQTVFPLYS